MKSPLWIVPVLYALDQGTKWWVVNSFEYDGPPRQYPVIEDFFYLVHWGNTGSAFSMFRDNNLAFGLLSVAVLVGLVIAWMRGLVQGALYRWGVAFLVSGILGNLTDRLIHHHVVDFLLFYLHIGQEPWPAFNVADSCICAAVGLFLLAGFTEPRTVAAKSPPA